MSEGVRIQIKLRGDKTTQDAFVLRVPVHGENMFFDLGSQGPALCSVVRVVHDGNAANGASCLVILRVSSSDEIEQYREDVGLPRRQARKGVDCDS